MNMCVLQHREVGLLDSSEIEVYSTEEEAVNRLYEILEEDYEIACPDWLKPFGNLVDLEKWCLNHNIVVSFSFHRLEK
jgi:hypothetical protein